MTSLRHAPRRANLTATNSHATPSIAFAAGWHAILKVAEKEAARDDLLAGSAHVVKLAIEGTVDDEPFAEQITATLSVGHDSTRATSATPDQNCVVGSILAKLNEVTRNAILRDLPEQFVANDEQTKSMLARLRAKKSVDVRGSVTCRYALVDIDAGGDGTGERALELAVAAG